MASFATLYDQLRTRNGWLYTEDISFRVNASLNVNVAVGSAAGTQPIPVTFKNLPQLSLNQNPGASSAYLVLRRLALVSHQAFEERVLGFEAQRQNNLTLNFNATTTGGTIVFTINALAGPSAFGTTLIGAVGVRRLHFPALPANCTITDIAFKKHWDIIYSSIFNAPFIGATDFDIGLFWDAQFGFISRATGVNRGVDIQITYNNTGVAQVGGFTVFATEGAQQGTQWNIVYQDWLQVPHNIGGYDDASTPSKEFLLDRLIPTPITDPGQADSNASWGSLIFTLASNMPFFTPTVSYDILLNASIAYIMPTGM
jgi:hypothetical protein